MCQDTQIGCLYVCKELYRRRELDLIDAYTTRVEDKKLLSQILPQLSAISSPSTSHLKRVYKGTILLGPVATFEQSNTREIFDNLNCKLVLETIKVPASLPLTREQYNFCQDFWPVNFREDTDLERRLLGTYFTDTNLQLLRQLMDDAGESDGCIITTNNYQIIGRASQSQMPSNEPLKHPFMRAFDNLVHSHAITAKRSASGEQYYGTDCTVFVYDEPCPMCSMAMVHARVKTVFFKQTSAKGAFLTNCQLHLKPQLNHHYEVYKLSY